MPSIFMPRIWMVSAEFGTYTDHFVNGGYAAVGWLPEVDLTSVQSRDEIFQRYREAHLNETSHVVGANAGQLATFILNIQPGDYIMTRCASPTRKYRYGVVEEAPLYYAPEDHDGCPFPYRRKVKWSEQPIIKEDLSIPLKKNLSAARTVFEVRHMEEFLAVIKNPPGPGESSDSGGTKIDRKPKPPHVKQYRTVLDQILKRINPTEFEYLTVALMEAMGYEGVQRTGGTHDGGVDVRGTLQSSLVNIDVYVQVKHYSHGRVSQSEVKKLHGAIPRGEQGAIITTSDFTKRAFEAADDPLFPRVTLINGTRLAELLMEHWNAESLAASPDPIDSVPSWHQRLGLTQSLVAL